MEGPLTSRIPLTRSQCPRQRIGHLQRLAAEDGVTSMAVSALPGDLDGKPAAEALDHPVESHDRGMAVADEDAVAELRPQPREPSSEPDGDDRQKEERDSRVGE